MAHEFGGFLHKRRLPEKDADLTQCRDTQESECFEVTPRTGWSIKHPGHQRCAHEFAGFLHKERLPEKGADLTQCRDTQEFRCFEVTPRTGWSIRRPGHQRCTHEFAGFLHRGGDCQRKGLT